MKSKSVVVALVLCIGMGFSAALAKNGNSSAETYNAYAPIDAMHLATDIDVNAALGPETFVYLEQDDICIDTTNTDPDFDPLSSFDAEILDALHDAAPETRIDYDPVTGTATIPNLDAISGASVLQTDGCTPEIPW